MSRRGVFRGVLGMPVGGTCKRFCLWGCLLRTSSAVLGSVFGDDFRGDFGRRLGRCLDVSVVCKLALGVDGFFLGGVCIGNNFGESRGLQRHLQRHQTRESHPQSLHPEQTAKINETPKGTIQDKSKDIPSQDTFQRHLQNSVAFCSLAKSLTFSGLMKNPIVGKKLKS